MPTFDNSVFVFVQENITSIPTRSSVLQDSWQWNSLYNSLISPFLQALLSGIISSAVFIYLVYWFIKPKIVISPTIAKGVNAAGQDIFRFKIVNLSRFRAFDISISVQKVTILIQNGNHVRIDPIPLSGGIKGIPFLESKKAGEKDPHNIHACRFGTLDDIPTMLSLGNCYLEVQVVARHGVSGLPRVFTRRFDTINAVKTGAFEKGSNLDVV